MIWVRRGLWVALALSALTIAARAIVGPFRLGVSVTSPMNAEGVFALCGAALLAGGWRDEKEKRVAGKPDWRAVAVLVLAGAVAFGWTFRFPFLADDYDHIPHAIHADPKSLKALFTQPAADRFFRPAVFVLYAGEARLAGYSRMGWHALSAALHVGVSVLVLLLARRRGVRRAPAMAAALLFLLHGSRPEAVTWIAAQFDLWAALFFLTALLLFDSGHRALSLAALLPALLSKEAAYVYPLALVWMLWVDGAPLRRWPRLAAPSWLLTAAVFAYRWHLVGGIGGYRDVGTGRAYILTFDFLRTGKALTARLAAAMDFPLNWSHRLEWWAVAALLIALIAGSLLFAARANRRQLWFGLGFLLVAALPVHEFLLIDGNLEKSRVLYLPSVGLALMFAAALEGLNPRVAAAAGCAVLMFQIAALEHNLRIWDDVSHLAERTCAQLAASKGPLPDAANTIDGVYFLHTGLRGCVEAAGK